MFKAIVFDSLINTSSVSEVISIMEDNRDEHIKMYFTTDGGDSDAAFILIDYIKNSGVSIELCAVHSLSSAGFNIAYLCDAPCSFTENAYSIVHRASAEWDKRKVANDPNTRLNKEANTNADEWVLNETKKRGFPQDLMAKIINFEDVQLNAEELRKIFKKRDEINNFVVGDPSLTDEKEDQ